MTDHELQTALRPLIETVHQIQREVGRLQGRQHAVHREQIAKGLLHPATPACPPQTIREERIGFDFGRLLRPFNN
jgi:hypothetical protein